MDSLIKPTDNSMTIVLHGSVRGKTVASIAHAYALTHAKLALPYAADNAPWKIKGKNQDMFTWRRALVEEQNALRLTLTGLFSGPPIEPGIPVWQLHDGRAIYSPELANSIAQQYARNTVKFLGLAE